MAKMSAPSLLHERDALLADQLFDFGISREVLDDVVDDGVEGRAVRDLFHRPIQAAPGGCNGDLATPCLEPGSEAARQASEGNEVVHDDLAALKQGTYLLTTERVDGSIARKVPRWLEAACSVDQPLTTGGRDFLP
jgi:hypothetical protein